MGLHEGLGIVEESPSVRMRSTFPDVPFGDIVKGVDRFYQEPENLTFPVNYALEIFTLKVNGSTQAEIEKKIAGYRQHIRNVEDALKKKPEKR